jgi:hypothetical protein
MVSTDEVLQGLLGSMHNLKGCIFSALEYEENLFREMTEGNANTRVN